MLNNYINLCNIINIYIIDYKICCNNNINQEQDIRKSNISTQKYFCITVNAKKIEEITYIYILGKCYLERLVTHNLYHLVVRYITLQKSCRKERKNILKEGIFHVKTDKDYKK